MTAVETYRAERARRQAVLDAKLRAHAWFSRARLLVVAIGVVMTVAGGLRGLPWLLAPLGVFVALAIAHGQLLNARDRAASAVAFFDRGLARMAHEWIGRGRTGEAYAPAGHIYAADLDIFGRGSLFELLATTRTQAGEETLAGWLLTAAPPDVVVARQAAVRELAGRLDLREAVAVLGDQLRVGVNAPLLRAWASTPTRLRGGGWRLGLLLLVATSLAAMAWWARTGGGGPVLIALLAAELGIAQWLRPRVVAVIDAVDAPAHDLDLLVGLLRTIERESFTSPHLRAVQQAVGQSGHEASREIARLSQLVAILASRRNVLFAFPAALMLWATQWALSIEAWRVRAGAHIPQWLDAVGEFEALLALGTFAAEREGYAWPEFTGAKGSMGASGSIGSTRSSGSGESTRSHGSHGSRGIAMVDAHDVAHPLLPSDAVTNSLTLSREGVHLAIVSGSNMSGKSTFLRALGVNVVLAQMGAPVRASAFELSPLWIGAAIRVQDSLADGQSRFFAEITRLKQVVDLTRAHSGDVLFLLDEILSGTNSHDRRTGAEALLTGLVDAGAIGLVTTHDLALGEIADRLPGQAINVHFEDRFENGVLRFDYRLKDGVVRTSNALELMRSIGLEI